ncbi:uncharacterized protein G2W53_012293 [Senna tora]|uniref:Uncharacterized protein n=1 Tax=Senna tora TaxID=362788 RepID=A0A834U164_9FABA|nr:uncharacterized protein G2W53_012293 [Senna tora]
MDGPDQTKWGPRLESVAAMLPSVNIHNHFGSMWNWKLNKRPKLSQGRRKNVSKSN